MLAKKYIIFLLAIIIINFPYYIINYTNLNLE